jgi:hypothetical protein
VGPGIPLPWFQVGRVVPGIPTLVSGGEGGPWNPYLIVSGGEGGPWNPYLSFRWGGWALEFTAIKCAGLAGVAAGLQAGTLRSVQITQSSPIRNSPTKT